MIEKLKYVYAGALALAAVAFVACDDGEEGLNGWTDTAYVYVQGETLGNDAAKSFVVAEREGLVDDTPLTYTFRVCLNRPAGSDVTVSLTPTASGGVADVLENTVNLNPAKPTIPAGQLTSDEITLTIDPAFLAVTDAVQDYAPAVFTIALGDLETASRNVRLSTKTNKITATCKKTVTPFKNLVNGVPDNAVLMSWDTWELLDYSNFMGIIFGDEFFVDWSTITVKTTPAEAVFDMGKEVTVLGGHTLHGWTTPRTIEILTSLDNETWEPHSTLDVQSKELEGSDGDNYTQDWKLKYPVTARYLKYRVVAVPGSGTTVATIQVYIPAE